MDKYSKKEAALFIIIISAKRMVHQVKRCVGPDVANATIVLLNIKQKEEEWNVQLCGAPNCSGTHLRRREKQKAVAAFNYSFSLLFFRP